MEVILAKSAGFCMGVKRAINLALDTANSGIKCATLGPLIHNRHMTEYLSALGVLEAEGVDAVPNGFTAIIRSHGVEKRVFDTLKAKKIPYVDATCPYVSKIHKTVKDASIKNKKVVIIGSRTHPEVRGIAGWCHDPVIFETSDELSGWLKQVNNHNLPIVMVCQTTSIHTIWKTCSEIIKKQCTNFEIFDTICNATENRQCEAAELAERCDAMVVVGDPNSSNTNKLADICRRHCNVVALVDSAAHLDMDLFRNVTTVGITAGASTPAWIIKEVFVKMSDEIKVDETGEITENETIMAGTDHSDEVIAAGADDTESVNQDQAVEPAVDDKAEESFAELLEKSIKTLNTGEKVTGVVTAITPTEIYVDLGAKQAGYIPLTELSDDPTVKVEDLIKIGDEIETYILRVNDVEGTVMLSKKRLDTVKSWDDIEAARESHAIVEGIVTEDNKGGVIVSVKGVRVFIPASQTGLGKDVPMSGMIKKRVRLRITEVNRARRRVVGSVRAVMMEERREKAENVWAEIEEGKKYKGIVKSLTSYGAFVDIGGVDGMVHVSELSWSRVNHPSKVLTVGDEIDVFILSFDREAKKISLGYRTPESNPWLKFTAECKIGDVVDANIVKLMTFGAFAEILPGVDGLIHISQIADRRINKPDDVLSVGQQVQVKIVDIDNEKQKISLSIRALLEQDKPVEDDGVPTIVASTDHLEDLQEGETEADDEPESEE